MRVKDGLFCEIVEWSKVLHSFFSCGWANNYDCVLCTVGKMAQDVGMV